MKRLTLKNLILIFISLTTVAFCSSCAKDYDDQMKQLEQTVAGNKQIIEGALSEQIQLMEEQIALLEKELQDYTDQSKTEMLKQVSEQLQQLKENLETKIEALAASVEGQITALDGRITSLKELIDAQLLVIGYRLDQIDESLNLLTSRISDLENRASALEEYRRYVEGALQELYGSIDDLEKALSALRTEYETANAERKTEIEANTRLIEENKTLIEELAVKLENLGQELLTAVDDLEEKIEAASQEAAEALARAVELLEVELKNWTQGQLDLLREWTEQELDSLASLIDENRDSISVNTRAIGDLRRQLDFAISEFTFEIAAVKDRLDELEDRVGELEVRAGTLEQLFEELVDSLNDRQNGILADIINEISGIAGDLLDAQARIETLEEGLANYYSKNEIEDLILDIIDQLNNTRTDMMGYITDILTRLSSMMTGQEIEDRLQQITDGINAGMEALQARIAELERLLLDLRTDVDNLLGRVQSITYVPDNFLGIIYFNGVLSADSNHLFRIDEVNLNYLVSPASAAVEIASSFYQHPESFSIITNQAIYPLAIRDDIVKFNITSITADIDGMLYVHARPEIVDLDAFLDDTYTYQASFSLSTEKGDVRTTQFVDVLKSNIEIIDTDNMTFAADMSFFATEASDDPNDPVWFGQASKMISVDIDPATGILSPWEGLKNINTIVDNQLFEDRYRLDPAKIRYTRRIAGQYIYSGQTNHQISPKTVSFSNGVLSSDARYADRDYANEKCMVEITVYYDGVLISSGNYACIRFIN